MIKYIHFPSAFSGKNCRRLAGAAAALVLSVSLAAAPLQVMAKEDFKILRTQDGLEDYYGEMLNNQKQTIQTNQIPSWPKGPAISAASAVVMDADSGTILYSKNQDMRLYPASITKVMTALLAYENLSLSDTVTFSQDAVFSIEFGSSNIGMDVGESITVDQALNGLLIASANEVANALGERVSGSNSAFIDLMNTRSEELGCTRTHFVTTNGLHDEDHYSTAHDMALIAKEVFKYPKLIEYFTKTNYHFESSANQPDDFWLGNTNSFLTGEVPCEDVLGGKTGYTDQARETLVTFAQRGDLRLVCVVMRDEPPHQYYDTVDILEYAFDNFKKVKVAEKEDRFTLKAADFLHKGEDIFGSSSPGYFISDDAFLTIPKNASFRDLDAQIFSARERSGDDSTSQPAREAGGSSAEDGSSPDKGSTGQAAEQDAPDTAGSPGEDASDGAGGGTLSDAASPSNEQENGKSVLGEIRYLFQDYEIGTAKVLFEPSVKTAAGIKEAVEGETEVPGKLRGIRSFGFHLLHTGAHGSVYLNILLLLPLVLAVTFLLCIFFFVHSYFSELKRRRRRVRNRGTKRTSDKDRSGSYEDDPFAPSEDRRPRRPAGSARNSARNSTRNSVRNTKNPGRNPGRTSSSKKKRSSTE